MVLNHKKYNTVESQRNDEELGNYCAHFPNTHKRVSTPAPNK